jgi:hypothetical protein
LVRERSKLGQRPFLGLAGIATARTPIFFSACAGRNSPGRGGGSPSLGWEQVPVCRLQLAGIACVQERPHKERGIDEIDERLIIRVAEMSAESTLKPIRELADQIFRFGFV